MPLLAMAKPSLAQLQASIKVIVPFSAGGTTDLVGRIVSEALSKVLDTPVVVQNKAGAGGAIGMGELAKAAPDGLTLGIANLSTQVAIPVAYKKPPYNPASDFTYIGELALAPAVLLVRSSLPVNNMAEFIRYARARPGQLSYGSPGIGSAGHFGAEIFKVSTRTFIVHIPYRGGAGLVNDLVAGHLDMGFDQVATALPHVRAGRLRALAVTWPARLPELPEVPTFAEVSLPDNNGPTWFGLVGPARMAQGLRDKLNASVNRILETPHVRQRMEPVGLYPSASSPDQFASRVASDIVALRRIARGARISLD